MDVSEQVNAELQRQIGAMVIDLIAAGARQRALEAENAALKQQLGQKNGG